MKAIWRIWQVAHQPLKLDLRGGGVGMHTTEKPAKASSIPSRLTLQREINLKTTMMKVRMPTKRRAALAGPSRFCIRRAILTSGGTAPDWTAAATFESTFMAGGKLGRAADNFVEGSRADRRRGTFQRYCAEERRRGRRRRRGGGRRASGCGEYEIWKYSRGKVGHACTVLASIILADGRDGRHGTRS
jgi:hypothetical protein